MPVRRSGTDVHLPCGHRCWATHTSGDRIIYCPTCGDRALITAITITSIEYTVNEVTSPEQGTLL